jgi:hypothetical protein
MKAKPSLTPFTDAADRMIAKQPAIKHPNDGPIRSVNNFYIRTIARMQDHGKSMPDVMIVTELTIASMIKTAAATCASGKYNPGTNDHNAATNELVVRLLEGVCEKLALYDGSRPISSETVVRDDEGNA